MRFSNSIKMLIMSLILSGGLIGFTVFYYQQLRQDATHASITIPVTVWSLTKMEREYAALLESLRGYEHGIVDHESLVTAFDVLWNRVDVVLISDAESTIRELNGVVPLFSKMQAELARSDELLSSLASDQTADIELLQQRFSVFNDPIKLLTLDIYTDRSQYFQDFLVGTVFTKMAYYWAFLVAFGVGVGGLLLYGRWKSLNQSQRDLLTNLYNFNFFSERLTSEMEKMIVDDQMLAVALINLKNLDQLNERFGSVAGDEALVAFSTKLAKHGLAARSVGAEVALLIKSSLPSSVLRGNLDELYKDLAKPLDIKEGLWEPEVAMGVRFVYPQEACAEKVLSDAEFAMRQIESGYCIYEESLKKELRKTAQIRESIISTVRGDTPSCLYLTYFPLVDLRDQKVLSVEVLLQSDKNSDLGPLSQSAIFDAASVTDIALELNRWVIDKACQARKEGYESSQYPLGLFVNITAEMFLSESLLEELEQQIQRWSLSDGDLAVEVTEDAVLNNMSFAAERVKALRKLGVSVVLKGFGEESSTSSLSMLTKVPFNAVKLDASLFKKGRENYLNIQAMISVIKNLSMRVIAEGVESQDMFDFLQRSGCDLGQGFQLYSPVVAQNLRFIVPQSAKVDCTGGAFCSTEIEMGTRLSGRP